MRLGLRPFVLNRVEVGAVWRQVFEGVSGIFDHLSGVFAFVKGGVVHDQDGPRWQLRDQVVLKPKVEQIGVDIGLGQADGEQRPGDQRCPRALVRPRACQLCFPGQR